MGDNEKGGKSEESDKWRVKGAKRNQNTYR